MKTKLQKLILILALTPFTLIAQSNYYYYNGGKIYLNLDKSSLYINTNNTFQKISIENQNLLEYDLKDEPSEIEGELNKWSIIEFETEPTDTEYYQKTNTLKNISTIDLVYPSYTTMNGDKISLSRTFYVKLKSPNDLSILQQKASENSVIIKGQNQFMPLWYTLVCTKYTLENSLDIANSFYESGLFTSCSPNFISRQNQLDLSVSEEPTNSASTCVNDFLFGNQWNLENTGQVVSTNPTINAVAGIDINACEAWNITTGDNDITVAVLDTDGVDLNHPDLTNMHPLSYDALNDASPSVAEWPHATACAGIIGGTQNNNRGVSGISPDCKVMSISLSLIDQASIARAVNFAWQNGADILSNSWKTFTQSDLIDEAYENALTQGRNGKGCIIVFSSGNNEGLITEYPANLDDRFIVVGAMSPCGERKSPNSCDLDGFGPQYGSAYGVELDIVAPGVFIPTTDISGTDGWDIRDYILNFKDTSAATPHVAAIAGLILSANPNLTNIQVNNIIENTAQKVGSYSYQSHPNRPNGTWNNEMGYGLVDAHAAVVLAQNMNTSAVDLYTKDTPSDFGIEPNISSNYTFLSQDIWVRHQQDGLSNFTHQTPLTNTNNYIYVKVRNKGAEASVGNEKLHLYWSTQHLNWPSAWIGNYGDALSNQTPILYGDEVGSVTIPSISAGGEAILEFNMDFNPPFPGLYGSYYKLLTRIVSINDAIISETSNIHDNILNNNNIASKSVYVSNNNAPFSRTLNSFHNPTDSIKTYRLEFIADDTEYGKAIYSEAEIHIELNQDLYNAWNNGGKQGSNFKLTDTDNSIIVTNNNFVLDNITLLPNQHYSLDANFHFLTKELTDKNQFTYRAAQYDKNDNSLIDITHITIQKEIRTLFLADAGNDTEIDENETITISAVQINEAAHYNWYDMEGNLIYQGKDLTVSADVTKKYKLEIIAETDGYKDYDEIEVKLKPSILEIISPNPATDEIQVYYNLNGVNSAYLMIIGQYDTSTSNNYILDNESSQTTINIVNYTNGFYTVALVCDGNIVDAKTLLKI